jgi:hypothetical protein
MARRISLLPSRCERRGANIIQQLEQRCSGRDRACAERADAQISRRLADEAAITIRATSSIGPLAINLSDFALSEGRAGESSREIFRRTFNARKAIPAGRK